MLDTFINNKLSPRIPKNINGIDTFENEKIISKQIAIMIRDEILNNVTDIYKNKILLISKASFNSFIEIIYGHAIRSKLTGKSEYLILGITSGLSLLLLECKMEYTYTPIIPAGTGISNIILGGGIPIKREVDINTDPSNFVRQISSIIQVQLSQVTGIINYMTPNGTPMTTPWTGLK